MAQTAIDVNKCLNQFIEDAKKFNSREALFEMETTSYDKIQSMMKEFQPYSNLWITADNWNKYYQSWMKDPLETVDAVQGEKFVEESVRILTGVTRFFKDRNINGVLKIAQQVKQNFDEFRPKVPLLVALRKPGMVTRHWKAISDNVGFEVNPQIDNFTFEKILDMGLMKNIDFCVEVGERAAKEYQIETMLDEMEAKWEDINF